MRSFKSLFAVAGALMLVQVGHSQVDVREQPILNALTTLRYQSTVTFQITGTERVGTRNRSFTTYVYWTTGSGAGESVYVPAKVEIDEYDTTSTTPVLRRRIVGDGTTYFNYDISTHRYNVARYGYDKSQASKQYPGANAALLTFLNSNSEGTTSYAVKFLKDIYGGAVPTLRAWAPAHRPRQITLPVNQPTSYYQDPIVATRSYIPASDGEMYVTYGQEETTTNRSVAFRIDTDSTTNVSSLGLVCFAERGPNRITDWSMIFVPVETPKWAYQPYSATEIQNWMPVAQAVSWE